MLLSSGDPIGDYEIESLLGEGGAATVWSVRHRERGARYALKVLIDPDERRRQRLIREGRLQAALEHENVLPVLEVLEVDGAPALLMPLVEGPSLDVLLARHRPSRPEALALFAAVVRGLDAAHRRGLIHRDLKPANVLLDIRRGRVVPQLADFGLARAERSPAGAATEGLTRSGEALGTPAWSSPEQLRGEPVDRRADLWSLGVMLCELLAGERPFPGRSMAEIVIAHTGAPALDGLPADTRGLAASLLAPDPTDRPADCRAVLDALTALGDGVAHDPLRGPLLDAAGRILRAADRADHNLPAESDPFFGRARELAALSSALSADRLVTLTGPGGAGKTRLALRLARQSADRYPGGIWFVDLAEVRSAEGIVVTAAEALGVALGADPADQLARKLVAAGRCLLVLDNFEQIVAHAPETVGRWLAETEAALLVTSRAALGIDGERAVALEPLPSGPAAALFTERARAAGGHLAETPGAVAEVDALVALLDGLPLAIELAAARARLLSPSQIRERLSRRFSLLKSRDRSLPRRQRTLAAALEWSWGLLTPWEQAALAQLSVFEGGFSIDDVRAVVDLGRWPEIDVAGTLAALVRHSLVRRRPGQRRGLLVSVQAFAARQLDDDARRAAELRHGRRFQARGLEVYRALVVEVQSPEFQAKLAPDLDNLTAAALRAAARRDGEVAGDAARGAIRRLRIVGPLDATLRLCETVIAVVEPSKRQFDMRLEAGWSARRMGQPRRARAHYEAALAWAQETGHVEGQGLMHVHLAGLLRLMQDLDGALAHARDARRVAEERGSEVGLSQSNEILALVLSELGEYDRARDHRQQALSFCLAQGDERAAATMKLNLGVLELDVGDPEETIALTEQAMAIWRARDMRSRLGIGWSNLGSAWQLLGEPQRAREALEAALRIARETGMPRFEASALMIAGSLERQLGALDAAEPQLEAVLEIAQRIDNSMLRQAAEEELARCAIARGQSDAADAHLKAARSGPIGYLSGLLYRCTEAEICALRGQRGAARAALAEVEAAVARLEVGPRSTMGTRLRETRAALAAAEREARRGP